MYISNLFMTFLRMQIELKLIVVPGKKKKKGKKK